MLTRTLERESSEKTNKSAPKTHLTVQNNDFVIVPVPTYKGTPKNYIAQVVDVKDNEILVSFLKKSFDKYFFPKEPDFSWVNPNEIVNVGDVARPQLCNFNLIFASAQSRQLNIFPSFKRF